MKLYTEEQVRKSLMKHQNSSMFLSDDQIDYLISELTPIELPSDELIIANRWWAFEEVRGLEYDETSYVDGFSKGAKWMRAKTNNL